MNEVALFRILSGCFCWVLFIKPLSKLSFCFRHRWFCLSGRYIENLCLIKYLSLLWSRLSFICRCIFLYFLWCACPRSAFVNFRKNFSLWGFLRFVMFWQRLWSNSGFWNLFDCNLTLLSKFRLTSLSLFCFLNIISCHLPHEVVECNFIIGFLCLVSISLSRLFHFVCWWLSS